MKNTKLLDLISGLIILATIGSVFYFYPLLPERVITHWNFAGQADGYSSKNFQVIFFPALIIFMYLLFWALPKIDPKNKNYANFLLPYKVMQTVFITFMATLFFVTSLVNIGYNISISVFTSLGIGIMFIILGWYMPHLKPNWFVGIRTPWTLSNDEVWARTHRVGGKVFIFAGVLFVVMPYLGEQLFVYSLILFFLMIISTVFYSYWLHRKQS